MTIDKWKNRLPIAKLCDLASISRDGYYHWRRNKDKLKENDDTLVLIAARAITRVFSGYGYRRTTYELKRRGHAVNHKRIYRIMKENCLLKKKKRKFMRTTNSNHPFGYWPNLIKDLVAVKTDQVWVADITYIRLPYDFTYLACILDAYSRKVIGWNLGSSLGHELTLDALRMALVKRNFKPGLIHHSDRGVQYACDAYIDLLKKNGISVSMSAKGNPYENAKAESFFKTLKCEEVYLSEYETTAEARLRIGKFIEDVYNKKRLHSSLGYLPPDEFERNQKLVVVS